MTNEVPSDNIHDNWAWQLCHAQYYDLGPGLTYVPTDYSE